MIDLIPIVEANNDDEDNEIFDDEFDAESYMIIMKKKELSPNDVGDIFNEDFDKLKSSSNLSEWITTSKLIIVKDQRKIGILSEVFLSACN
jgi:hypothetical protein